MKYPKKNRACPYHGDFCHDYGSCDSCDHGIAYARMSKKLERYKKMESASVILVIEANNYDYNIVVLGVFADLQSAQLFVKQRFYELLDAYRCQEGDECSYTEFGYNVYNGDEVVYGTIMEIGRIKVNVK